jgi:O-antigen/teichoic acid export membrane protein
MIFKSIKQNLETNLLITVLGLVGSIILARWLGPSQRGVFAAIILIPNILQYVVNFGLSSATFYFTAIPNSDKHKIWSSLLSLSLVQSLLGISVGFVIIKFYLPKLSGDVVFLGGIYLLTIPMWLLGMYATYMLQGASYFNIANFLKAVIPTAYCLGIIVLKWLNILSIENMVYIQLCIQFIYAIISVFFLHKYLIGYLYFSVNFETIKELFNYGLKVWIGDISQLANTRIDQFLIGFFLDSHDLGIYMVAFSIANFSSIFAQAFRTTIAPIIASEAIFNDKVSKTIFFFKSYWVLSVVFHLVFIVSVPILVPLIFGQSYEKSIFISQILIIGSIFINAKFVLSGAIQGMKFPEIVSFVEVVGMIISLIFCYFLVKTHGIVGVSSGLSFSYFSQFVVLIFYIHQRNIISYKSLLKISLQEIQAYYNQLKRV